MTESEPDGEAISADDLNGIRQAGYNAYLQNLASPTAPISISIYDALFYGGEGYLSYFLQGVSALSARTQKTACDAWNDGARLAHIRQKDIYSAGYSECCRHMATQPFFDVSSYLDQMDIASPYTSTQKSEDDAWKAGYRRAHFDGDTLRSAGYDGQMRGAINPHTREQNLELLYNMWNAGAGEANLKLWQTREDGYRDYMNFVVNNEHLEGIYEERACNEYLQTMVNPHAESYACLANAWCEGVQKAQLKLAELYYAGCAAYGRGSRSNPLTGQSKAECNAWEAGNKGAMHQKMMVERNLMGDPSGCLPYSTHSIDDDDDDDDDERRPGPGGWPSTTGNPSGGGRDNA